MWSMESVSSLLRCRSFFVLSMTRVLRTQADNMQYLTISISVAMVIMSVYKKLRNHMRDSPQRTVGIQLLHSYNGRGQMKFSV